MPKITKEIKPKVGRPRKDPRAAISIYCREEHKIMLKKIAFDKGITCTDLVTQIFEEYFKRNKK